MSQISNTTLVNHLLLFTKIVSTGSFSAAARELDVSTSAVSRHFRQLEDQIGLRLLNRTTRKIVLTDEGRRIYESANRVATELDELEILAMDLGKKIGGTLRISCTVAFGKAHLLPLIPEFLVRFPELNIELDLTDRPVDLVSERQDIAIRFSEQVGNNSVIVRKLAKNQRVICASPEYLKLHGKPEHPDDLVRHNCLRSSTVSGWNGWEFEIDGARKIQQVSGNFKANSADAVYRAALAGLGIARLSEYLISSDLRSGKLVRILDGHAHETSDLMAIYPDRRNLAPKVRVFLDYLVDYLSPVPPWEST